jgi:hypothetical protein
MLMHQPDEGALRNFLNVAIIVTAAAAAAELQHRGGPTQE